MAGILLIALTLIICATVLLGIYIYQCAENDVKMFADPRYDERINELEKRIKDLEGKE